MVVRAQEALANNQDLEKQPELMQFFMQWFEENQGLQNNITPLCAVPAGRLTAHSHSILGEISARDFTND